jgi:peptidoglycan/LPS O-acetylase OafA/YrhL
MPTKIQPKSNRTLAPSVEAKAPAKPAKAQRIPALDFTKGALVLIMVLFHWINYFVGPQWGYYRYLGFLTSSFIFITGFMISNVYLSKYAAADPRLSKRLFTRGLKLLAIFVALNLVRSFVGPALGTRILESNPFNLGNIFTIFVSGNLPFAGGKLVAFAILVPIGYLLILAGALMLLYRMYRYTFQVACLFLLLSIAVMGWNGARSENLELITIGMLGVVVGFTPIAAIDNFIRHPYILAFAYVCYTIAITIWNIPFPLLIAGVCLSLAVIYLVGASSGEPGVVRREVILLGKYSLLGYISQIAVLQLLRAGFRHIDLGVAAVLSISFLAAFALTIASVEAVDRVRARMASFDKLYKAVFA